MGSEAESVPPAVSGSGRRAVGEALLCFHGGRLQLLVQGLVSLLLLFVRAGTDDSLLWLACWVESVRVPCVGLKRNVTRRPLGISYAANSLSARQQHKKMPRTNKVESFMNYVELKVIA